MNRVLQRTIVLLCSITVYASVFSQTAYLGGDEYRYFSGNSEPPANWNQHDFNDASWSEGYSVIGFGNTNDSTIIAPAPSLYIRINFSIEDVTAVSKLTLLADYNDGYIAYINGVEVVRINMGAKGSVATHDATATRSRKMQASRNQCEPLLGYFIDSSVLKQCLQNGENTLAIQVHNDSIDGQNLGIQFSLLDISHASYNPYWWEFKAIKQIDFDSTHLPIVKIFTDEKGIYSCSEKVTAHMEIISNDSTYNKYTDSANNYSGYIGIEPRGESSLHWPKKNYSVETRDEFGNNLNTKILGMPKENDWILHGPFSDRSLVRNALAYNISNQIGQYASRTRFCELFINDEYLGVYVFLEKIKPDDDRVDIRKLLPSHVADVTGGYIIKYDKDASSGSIKIVYPKEDSITIQQQEYIQGYYRNYLMSLHDSVILNPERGYRKYVDISSYIDFTIINEIFRNPDAYLYSTYMYKDTDDKSSKLQFGPVWDFDLAMGNSTFQNAGSPAGWQFAQSTNRYLFHTRMFKDTNLVNSFAERWFDLRAKTLHNDSLIWKIDSLTAIIGDGIERNKDAWQLENNYILSAWGQYISYTYEEDMELLKNWILDRAEWIDENIESIYYPYTYKPVDIANIPKETCTVSMYPNPVHTTLFVKHIIPESGTIEISITNIHGLVVKTFEQEVGAAGEYLQCIPTQDLPSGTYTVQVHYNKVWITSKKIIIQ